MNTPAALTTTSRDRTGAHARLLDWSLDLTVRAYLWLVDRCDPDSRQRT